MGEEGFGGELIAFSLLGDFLDFVFFLLVLGAFTSSRTFSVDVSAILFYLLVRGLGSSIIFFSSF